MVCDLSDAVDRIFQGNESFRLRLGCRRFSLVSAAGRLCRSDSRLPSTVKVPVQIHTSRIGFPSPIICQNIGIALSEKDVVLPAFVKPVSNRLVSDCVEAV